MSITMASGSSHRSPKSSAMVDFSSLVWPPPELRPPPTPKPLIVHGANNTTYKVYPGQSLSEARRLAGIKRSGTPSSALSDHSNRPPLRPTPSQTPSRRTSGPSDSKSKGRFGCKDFPAGYVPTPRPPSPPVIQGPSQSQSQSFHSSQPMADYGTSMGFFEPIGTLPRPNDPYSAEADFISPVMENGRVVSHCRISGKSGLSPGGIIEKGWQVDSTRPNTAQTLVGGLTPSPLKYVDQVQPTSYFPPSQTTNHTPSHYSQNDYNQTAAGSAIKPTRKGYWNRRGDTISPSGRIITAPHSQAHPPDLAHYPQYAFMNESGRVVLPEVEEERVAVWRNVV